jgi:uncharacterized DUF497 family protein
MDLEWDEAKRQKNLRERGIDFADAVLMETGTALTIEDNRTTYGVPRFLSYGFINARLHVLCWTPREGRMRIISLRKANDREQKSFSEASGSSPASH